MTPISDLDAETGNCRHGGSLELGGDDDDDDEVVVVDSK